MGLGLELLLGLAPRLLQVLGLIRWPGLDQGVQCLDAVDDDLICWIKLAGAAQIIGAIQEAILVAP